MPTTIKKGFKLETADANSEGAPTLDEATKIIVAHLVAQETEKLTAEIATLRDSLEIARKALVDKDAEFAAFRADLESKAETARLADTRKGEVAKALPALEATDERVARWASMSEVEFAAYLADVAAVATPKPSGTEPFGEKKAATAMSKAMKIPTENSAGRTVLGL